MIGIIVLLLIVSVVLAALYLHARADISASARSQYDQWRDTDRENIVQEQREIGKREAQLLFAVWKSERETELAMSRSEHDAHIRQDAITRAQAIIVGKVTEHVAPWFPQFPYNPRDARFIGSPIDMIVFDGCDDEDLRRIVFVEIKTGSSNLSQRQRQIRDAVRQRRVEWHELRIDTGEPRRLPPHGTPQLPV